MQTLADLLGSNDPPIEPPAKPWSKLTIKSFCKDILESPEYRDSIKSRILLGEIPPAVECMWYHYAYGKPADKLEVKDTTNAYENLSVEELEARATLLADAARHLRMARESQRQLTDGAVH